MVVVGGGGGGQEGDPHIGKPHQPSTHAPRRTRQLLLVWLTLFVKVVAVRTTHEAIENAKRKCVAVRGCARGGAPGVLKVGLRGRPQQRAAACSCASMRARGCLLHTAGTSRARPWRRPLPLPPCRPPRP